MKRITVFGVGLLLMGILMLVWGLDKIKSSAPVLAQSHHIPNIVKPDIQVQTILNQATGLRAKVLHLALTAYNTARAQGLDKRGFLTIIDYTLPSYEKRLWVINLNSNKVLFDTWVAHGQNTGVVYAKHFSDKPETHETSIGLFKTGSIYHGHDGISMVLYGLEKGWNDTAACRHVVMHGAWYVGPKFIQKQHRIGRSWGCPAVSQSVIKPIVETIQNGTLLFSYYPIEKWLKTSKYLNPKK